MGIDLKQLDDIYLGYNYEIKSKAHTKVRVYARKFGIYSAAEIVPLTENYKPGKLQQEYSSLGYATKIRVYKNIEEVERLLFKEYFLDSPFYQLNKNKYDNFVRKQLIHLPDGSKYDYVGVPYDYLIYENKGDLLSSGSITGQGSTNLVGHLMDILFEQTKPVFVIIEAAAGFGKTCTVFEILKTFFEKYKDSLPFFTELSKNREARVFKHILLNEINNHFPEGIKSDIVIKGINKGRIPLIIDGFDELLSKDLSDSSSSIVQAGNMLSTIMELLTQNAKVIITSRKTAIFDSESFNTWASENSTDFVIARISLKEPTIENWLTKEKIKIFEKTDYDIEKLSHPVILSYLRNLKPEDILNLIQRTVNNLFEQYFTFLLEREKERQNLLLEIEDQFKIFRGLIRFMIDLDFRADNKEGIKDFFRDYFKDDILKCMLRYQLSERPSFEDLVETLSNHVFLDRKEGGLIGFANDFIQGTLIGQGILSDDFKLNNTNCQKTLGLENAKLAVQAYKLSSVQSGLKLWSALNNCEFINDKKFNFEIDYIFTKTLNRDYEELQVENLTFKEIEFTHFNLNEISFINCRFNRCEFDTEKIKNSVFQKCTFYLCRIFDGKLWDKSNILENCKSDNGIEKIQVFEPEVELAEHEELLLESKTFLSLFFSTAGARKNRSLRQIKDQLEGYSDKQIRKMLKEFTLNDFLYKQGDIFFLSKQGLEYYNSLL
jgi:hypothetical protein